MSGMVGMMIAVLVVWMAVCAWCGFGVRLLRFLAVMVAGLAMNMLWMMRAFDAAPLEANALMAQTAIVLYGVSAFGAGYLAGRLVRQFRASRVEERGV